MAIRVLVTGFLLAFAGIAPSMAQATIKHQLNISRQPMGSALAELARQAKIQVIYSTELVEGMEAPEVRGDMTAEEALRKILPESGLGFEFVDKDTITLVAVTAAVPSRTSGDGVRRWAADLRVAQASENKENIDSETSQTSEGSAELSEDKSAKLEEIVVTATKRAEPLQDVPMSVTVLDEKLLLKTGAVDLVDYATHIPNLSFGATSPGALSLFGIQIRGVAGGTVGFYIDDVPVPESMNPRVMDISRIEVLRGPQGSLYGARSMGGTVRLITERADPTAMKFETHASAGQVAEGDMDYAVDSALNAPISPNLAFRGSAFYEGQTGAHDIVVNNPNVAGDEITHENADDGEYWGLQAMFTWKPTEHLTVEPRFIYQNSHLDWVPYSDLSPGNFTQRRVIDRADPSDQEWSISSLTVNWDTGWGRFTSATAFFNQETANREEISEFMNFASGAYGGDPNYYPPGGSLFVATGESNQITEELRFTSKFDGRLQLTAGVFYSQNDSDGLVPCSPAEGIGVAEGFSEATGIPFGTDCIFAFDSHGETEERAVFGEFEYAILDNLFLTLGGRYFENTRSGSVAVYGIFGGGPSPPPPTVSEKTSEQGFNPKIGLELNVTPDWTLYSSAAQGYRFGGRNGAIPTDFCEADLAALGLSAAPEEYTSDSLWSYEIGSKSALLNRRLSLNAAAYVIDWSDIIQGAALPCGFPITFNAGKAEIKGAEVEIAGQAADHLRYALGVGYTDAEIADPEGAAGLGIAKGDPLTQVPEWTFNANLDYQFNIGARDGYFFLGYTWVDSIISVNQGLLNPRVRDSYATVDARLGMTFGNCNIALFGKNLTDEQANLSDNISAAAETPGRPRYVINRPRTIGVDVRWVF